MDSPSATLAGTRRPMTELSMSAILSVRWSCFAFDDSQERAFVT